MRKADALIPNIQEKIVDFLQSRKFKSLTPLSKIFADPTRHSYYSVIIDSNDKRLFLKIRTHNLKYEKRTFKNQYLIGKVLRNNPDIPLAQYTPKLIGGAFGELDYLLYEYIEGENLGSRMIAKYGATKFKEKDIEQIVAIATALNTFPTNTIPNLERQTSHFYKDLIKESKVAKRTKVKNFLENNWKLFDQEPKYLSHGDFKPNNFLRTENGLLLTDFETVSLSNPYTDIASLWAYSISKHSWRNKLITRFITESKLSAEALFFCQLNQLIWSLYELWLLDLQSKKIQQQFRQARKTDVQNLLTKVLQI